MCRQLIVLLVLQLCSTSFISEESFEIKERISGALEGRHGLNDKSLEEVIVASIEKAKIHNLENAHFCHEITSSSFAKNTFIAAHSLMMAPKTEASSRAQKAHILEEATKLLVDQFGLEIMEEISKFDVSGLADMDIGKCLTRENCEKWAQIRNPSGWCNNLHFPSFGNAFEPLRRLLPPEFQDGISAPRLLSVSGRPLPSPRKVSNIIHGMEPQGEHLPISLMFVHFGQLIDHEITHSPVYMSPSGEALNCTGCQRDRCSRCFPIEIPENDAHFMYGSCLNFVRSVPGQRTLGPRQQMNQVTAFVDGSVFYGSSACEEEQVREFEGGRLRSTVGRAGRLLPVADDQTNCRSPAENGCFQAGDERNSQQSPLQALHTAFLRLHNDLASGLAAINTHWNDETTFQKTKRIIVALFAHIIYDEFLPKLLGENFMGSEEYDSNCDAAISQSFATAGFRFGHSLVARFVPRINPFDYGNYSWPIDLAVDLNDMNAIYDYAAGGVESIINGMLRSEAMPFDGHVSSALRNHLFERKDMKGSGSDLAAINIQRSRDHGVAGYNAHREFCGLQRVSSFDELHSELSVSSVAALQQVYDDVDDIDLFPAILSERANFQGLVGPTAACLIAEQFSRLRRCDRFFYSHSTASFTKEQLTEIRSSSLSSILCWTMHLPSVQEDSFMQPSVLNRIVPCNQYKKINLQLWANL